MIASFIFAALAAWGAPQLEVQIKSMLARFLPLEDISAVEMRGITIVILLFAAAILVTLLGSGNTLTFGLGAVAGILGPRGYRRFKQAKAPDYDS